MTDMGWQHCLTKLGRSELARHNVAILDDILPPRGPIAMLRLISTGAHVLMLKE